MAVVHAEGSRDKHRIMNISVRRSVFSCLFHKLICDTCSIELNLLRNCQQRLQFVGNWCSTEVTAMRKSEQYGLTWADIDLEARRVSLKRTKNRSARHVPLNSVALAAFKAIAAKNGQRGNVFGPADGSHPVLAHRAWWEAVVAKAGLDDFHWHDCRHHFASKAVMAGVDLRTLQQLLGHRTLQMVVRYSHLSQSHELAAVEKLCKDRLPEVHQLTSGQ